MPRKKAPGTQKRAGHKNDFTGKKLQLLENFASHWRQAMECDEQTDFYNKITMLAVKTWGYHEDYRLLTDEADEDEEEVNPPTKFSLLEEDNEDKDKLSLEEAERRQLIYKKLRTVSNIADACIHHGLTVLLEIWTMVPTQI